MTLTNCPDMCMVMPKTKPTGDRMPPEPAGKMPAPRRIAHALSMLVERRFLVGVNSEPPNGSRPKRSFNAPRRVSSRSLSWTGAPAAKPSRQEPDGAARRTLPTPASGNSLFETGSDVILIVAPKRLSGLIAARMVASTTISATGKSN
jgi:hypothetical protein